MKLVELVLNIDVNIEQPKLKFHIRRVGIVNVNVPTFSMKIGGSSTLAVAKVSAFIDLPATYKGIHASRSYESIVDVFLDCVGKEMKIEEFCSQTAEDLLKRHSYASRSEVRMMSLIVFPQITPKTEKISYERAYLIGRAVAKRKKSEVNITKRSIGVKVAGITACPSAQRTLISKTAEMLGKVNPDLIDEILKVVPKATHLQRAYAKLIIQLPGKYDVDAFKLIKIARKSTSSQTYELLKREDEAEVILSALNNPMFAEDVVRQMAKGVLENFPELPDETKVFLSIRSLESIHQHDLVAYLHTTLKQLRKTRYQRIK